MTSQASSPPVPQHSSADVVVIGGGPGGACTASALARAGLSVTVLERMAFPRYAVGESIIPFGYVVLDHIGALEKVRSAGFLRKAGFQFASSSGRLTQPYHFSQSIKDPRAVTWSVDRAKFDQLLLEHARDSGAVVLHEATVRDVIREGERVVGVRYKLKGSSEERSVRSKWVVDASGRGTVLSRRFGLREKDPRLDQLAVWRYLRGGFRNTGRDEGNIVIALLRERGWFWWIPMADGITSVGVVSSQKHLRSTGTTLGQMFQRALEQHPTLVEWTQGSTWITEQQACGDYSYTSSRLAGEGWVLVGDAAAFIDPVFSTGVWVAMASGVLAADTIVAGLARGALDASAFGDYEVLFRRGEDTFRVFLDAFYDPVFSPGRMFRDHPEQIPDWGRILQGDVYDDNRSFNDFLLSYRKTLADEAGVELEMYVPATFWPDHQAPDSERVQAPPLFRLRSPGPE